ncbi:uncharacterized protein LOC136083370 [Hydra vulgaris]|uniref:Uncharacterized protein LOC136083370 n=1 Tax=Hydra vulgaris TaxID=6087 RepID=A0ABM4CB11_HYDVU
MWKIMEMLNLEKLITCQKTLSDELVALMAKKVLQSISNEAKNSKYFGLSVDSTPDISHKNQLCIILRYVDDTTFELIERFIKFVQVEDHSGEKLAEVTINFLDLTLSLDISNCRSQAYDNAPNMSGKYKESNNVFGIVQQIYNLFSSSYKRRAILKKFSDRSVKSLSKTRWSARADSVNTIYRNYKDIKDSSNEIAKDLSFDSNSRAKAHNLIGKMDEFEFALQTVFWNTVLNRINLVSKCLQDSKITLDTCSNLYSSLGNFFDKLVGDYDVIEAEAKKLLPDTDYTIKRQRTNKRFPDESQTPQTKLIPKEAFRTNIFEKSLKILSVNLKEAYQDIFELFGFLTNLNISHEDLKTNFQKIMEQYSEDIDEALYNELFHLHNYIKLTCKSEDLPISHLSLYKIIKEKKWKLCFQIPKQF